MLGLQLADPLTIQAFETTVVNADFLALENGIATDRVRLTAIEGWDVARPGPNGSALFLAADVPTLDALATALIGDQALLTNPGTGADPYVLMTAISGTGATMIWRLTQDLIVDTKAHLDAIVTAWSTTGLQFEIGRTVQVAGTNRFRFTTTAGAYLGVDRVRPTTATTTSGTAVINDDGSVTITPVAAGTCLINSIFPPKATYGTDEFEVVVTITGSASATQTKLATGGVADPTTTNYDYFGGTWNQAGTAAASTQLGSANWPSSNGLSPIAAEWTLRLRHPGEALPTTGVADMNSTTTAGTNELEAHARIKHRASTIFDGLQIIYAAASVITVRVRPVL